MSREEINAFLGAGTVYQGKLTFQGAVRVDGVFSGEISSEGALIACLLYTSVWLLFAGGECLAAFFVLCSRILGRRRSFAIAGTFLAGAAAAFSYLMFLILLWSLLRGEQAPGGMGVPPGADALSILKGLVAVSYTHLPHVRFAVRAMRHQVSGRSVQGGRNHLPQEYLWFRFSA